ncbi:MAG: bifunctional 2',3'-cyclic-nucleotide 2'-phosphodiesterase/3'-nucleotidase [Pseudomonadota bacterium]
MSARHPYSRLTEPGLAHLRVLEITDIHMNLLPFDYTTGGETAAYGLSRTATLIDTARAEATNVLLFDNGDSLQGTALGDYVAFEQTFEDQAAHPLVAVYNWLGVDAATLGNHEFNYGIEFLMRALSGARYPVVSANVVRRRGSVPQEDRPLFPPYAILERSLTDSSGRTCSIRLGVIGFLPPQIMAWDRRNLEGRVEVREIVEAARTWVPIMQEAGADLIVALAHTGLGDSTPRAMMENAAIPLAEVEGIDVLLLGHKHMLFPSGEFEQTESVDPVRGTIHGKPAVMAGTWGSHLGLVDLLLERANGAWRVADFEVSTRAVAGTDENGRKSAAVASAPEIESVVQRQHSATLAFNSKPVGHTNAPIQSFFAELGAASSVELVLRAQMWAAHQLLADTPFSELPLLSAAAPFKVGGRAGADFYTDVPEGTLRQRHIADICIYPNTLTVVGISGRDLRIWIEYSACLFHQIPPGSQDAVLIDPDFSIYNFDSFSGLSYQIDLSQPSRFHADGSLRAPSAIRVTDLAHDGEPVQNETVFAVVTTSHRANGGSSFPGVAASDMICQSDMFSHGALTGYLKANGALADLRPRHWRFQPLPDTSVVFDTGQGARNYESEIAHMNATRIGPTKAGFLRYRLNL